MLELNTPATKKWKLHELSELVDNIENKIIEKVTENPIPYIQDYKNVILDISCKSIETIREVIILCAGGYPDGALSLSRNLYEHLIIVCFLLSKKDDNDFQNIIEDYYLDSDFQSYLMYCLENRYFGLTQEKLNKLNTEYNRIKSSAHKKLNERNNYWWTGENGFWGIVTYLEKKVKDDFKPLFKELHLEYKRACLSIHSNSFGNSVRLGSKAENYVIDNTAKVDGHGLPLWLATASFIQITVAICEEIDIDFFGLYKDDLNNLIAFFKKQALQDEGEL